MSRTARKDGDSPLSATQMGGWCIDPPPKRSRNEGGRADGPQEEPRGVWGGPIQKEPLKGRSRSNAGRRNADCCQAFHTPCSRERVDCALHLSSFLRSHRLRAPKE